MDFFENDNDAEECRWVKLSGRFGTFPSKGGARSLALVLDSRSIPCSIEYDGKNWLLLVPEPQLESAIRELQLYEEANRNWPPPAPAARQLIENTLPTICILIMLAALHNLTLLEISMPQHGIVDLKAVGTAHAEKILEGQWWLAVTALTLHTDLAHLLGNLAIGGVFVILLCRELGSGLAWSLLLASGTFGNLANALAQQPPHHSVGASTAVFGAVGILAAISSVRYRHHLRQRWLVPIAAGLALLAILGTEGKQTDLGAHMFGFCFGVFFGTITEHLAGKFGRPGAILNVLLGLMSGVVVIAAWWAAIVGG